MREASLPQHAPLVTASRQLPQTSCLCKSDGEPVTGLMSMHLAKHQVSKITVQVDPLLETWTGAPDFFSFTRKFFFLTRKFFSHPKVQLATFTFLQLQRKTMSCTFMRRMLFFFSILLLWCKWKRVVALIHYCCFIFNMVYYFFDSVCFCFQYFDLNTMSLTSKSQSD